MHFLGVLATAVLLLIPTSSRGQEVKELIVVTSSHLDAGFNDFWGDTHAPYCANVIQRHWDVYYPRAAEAAASMPDYSYMAQSFITEFLYTCPTSNYLGWDRTWWPWGEGGKGENGEIVPPGKVGDLVLNCPNATVLAIVKEMFEKGTLFHHAMPHNANLAVYDESLLNATLGFAQALSKRFSIPAPISLSQRDVPHMTRALLKTLVANGIEFVTVGTGGAGGGAPVIPDLFVWQDPVTGAEVLSMHDLGYGNKTHVSPNGTAVIARWNRDNTGPFTKEQMDEQFQAFKAQYPGADVHFGTFDEFARKLKPQKSKLPVVTSEIGDTWIHGVSADPFKAALFRSILRARKDFLNQGHTLPDGFDFLISKIPEHTGGLSTNFYFTEDNDDEWSNEKFQKALAEKKEGRYDTLVQSFLEQRSFLYNALDLLPKDSPLRQNVEADIAAINPQHPPNLAGFVEANFGQSYACGAVEVSFDKDTASIGSLKAGGVDVVEGAGVGGFVYQRLGTKDFESFLDNFGFQECDQNSTENLSCNNFMKPQAEFFSNGHMMSKTSTPTGVGLYRSGDNCSFWLKGMMSADDHLNSGAPAEVWTRSTFDANGVSSGSVDFEARWINKTATRLPETTYFSFAPLKTTDKSSGSWKVHAFSSYIDPTDVVQHGATHLHATTDDITYTSSSLNLTFSALDTPVWSLGLQSSFPTPPTPQDPNNGVWAVISNNIWNCNFAQFFPFMEADRTMAFRFHLDFKAKK